MSLLLNSFCGRQAQNLKYDDVTSNRELLAIWNGRSRTPVKCIWWWCPSCHVQIMKGCNIFMAGVGSLWFCILTEVLLCITTRAVSPLKALFGWMVLQAEAPGLGGGRLGRVGLVQESPGHAENRDFVSLVPFFKVENRSFFWASICLSPCWRGAFLLEMLVIQIVEKKHLKGS